MPLKLRQEPMLSLHPKSAYTNITPAKILVTQTCTVTLVELLITHFPFCASVYIQYQFHISTNVQRDSLLCPIWCTGSRCLSAASFFQNIPDRNVFLLRGMSTSSVWHLKR